jgi:hypothetical protein
MRRTRHSCVSTQVLRYMLLHKYTKTDTHAQVGAPMAKAWNTNRIEADLFLGPYIWTLSSASSFRKLCQIGVMISWRLISSFCTVVKSQQHSSCIPPSRGGSSEVYADRKSHSRGSMRRVHPYSKNFQDLTACVCSLWCIKFPTFWVSPLTRFWSKNHINQPFPCRQKKMWQNAWWSSLSIYTHGISRDMRILIT